ncbi:hypothetical protein V8C42DRAFT_254646 [Trichoderma barbatum]
MDTSNKTKPTNRPASFELLAPEILLQIVAQLPGLDTLWNLMRASPRTWHLFDEHALLITESIFSGPNFNLPSKFSELIRGVILVRSGIVPFTELVHLEAFLQGQIGPARYRYGGPGIQGTPLSPELLAFSAVQAETLRSVVATAYHLSALAQACLESCLVRIRDPGFRPMHAYDPPAQYTGDYIHNGQVVDNVQPEDRVFVGTPVNMIDVGEPSWVEEMRALRAMWVIQLLGELKCLAKDGPEKMCWLEGDVTKLRRTHMVDFVTGYRFDFQQEEVNTAVQYVLTLGKPTSNTYYRLPQAPSAAISARRTIISPKVNLNIPVAYGYSLDGKIHILKRGSSVPEGGKPLACFVCQWCQSEWNLSDRSPGIALFLNLTEGTRERSPLEGVKFDSFRPLGFAFWDRWRMYLLGLTGAATTDWLINGKRYEDPFYYFAWESLLSPEEVASVKDALREKRAQEIAQVSARDSAQDSE